MLKAILFDIDNTLIDFVRMKQLATYNAAKAMCNAGLTLPLTKAKKELLKTYYKVGIESSKPFQKFLKKHNQCNERILAAGINAYLSSKLKHLKPYKDVIPTLKKLRKYKLAIVSDAPKLKAYQRLDAMRITDFFQAVVCFEDTGRKKPSKLPFKMALKMLKVRPEEALFIGDRPERDVKGARAIGMHAVLAGYGYDGGKKAGLKRFKDILKVVKDLE